MFVVVVVQLSVGVGSDTTNSNWLQVSLVSNRYFCLISILCIRKISVPSTIFGSPVKIQLFFCWFVFEPN